MKKIPSFTIDHIHLLRGVYGERKSYFGDPWDAVLEIIFWYKEI